MASSHLNARKVSVPSSEVERGTSNVCFGIHIGLPIDEELHNNESLRLFFHPHKRKSIAPPHLYTLRTSKIRCLMERGPSNAISLFHIRVGFQQQFRTLEKSSIRCPIQSSPSPLVI